MKFESRFDIYVLFMILGVFQGIFLSYFYLSKRNRKHLPNLFWGLFLLTLTIIASEILLNYTGLIVKVIWIENYSEPFVFLLAPLLFFIIKTSLGEKYKKDDWIHFLPFGIYFIYCFLYFLQPPEFKYNSYVHCYQPGWKFLNVKMHIPDDPLRLRSSLEQLYFTQFLIYIVLIYQILKRNIQGNILNIFNFRKRDARVPVLIWIFFVLIFILILFIKIHFERDLGDYIIGSCLALLIYLSSFRVMRNSSVFAGHTQSTGNTDKYVKSALVEERKSEILNKLLKLMGEEKYFTKNTVSLSMVSKAIGEQAHHVSQTINEKLHKNFFELLADYRIDEAKRILKNPDSNNFTIEEIAEQIGYNSKSAFNKIFKKLTGSTPSEYRDIR